MPAERYYLDTPLHKGSDVVLQDQEFHHLVRVMRAAVGDSVEIINGQGCLAQAHLHQIDKRLAHLTITAVHNEKKPGFEIILAQALPRMNRLDFILEKGTELGMTQVWLFPGERSERKEMSEHQLERAQALCIAATKQCGRLWRPTLLLKSKLQAWKRVEYLLFYGDVSPKAEKFHNAWKRSTPQEGVILCIGPESGFTEQEENKLKELSGCGVQLHPNILRTDTAALAALSQLYTLIP